MRRTITVVAAILFAAVGLAVGQGMMGPGPFGGMMGWGAMGGAWEYAPPGAKALTIDQVSDTVGTYLQGTWGKQLELAEVMEFDNHFYAEVEEAGTGIHAFELLINKYSGSIIPEPGPNMMWNTKYGHMGVGMMGGMMMGGPSWGWGGRRRYRNWPDANKEMPIPPEKARQYAQEFLTVRLPGTIASDEVGTFYGYYTIHVLKDGKTYGMLGVNGYSGWVWYHQWHGTFIRMKVMED
jgi:hypothetical protein